MIFVVWATEMKDWVRFIVLCMSNITSAWNITYNVDELPSEGLPDRTTSDLCPSLFRGRQIIIAKEEYLTLHSYTKRTQISENTIKDG